MSFAQQDTEIVDSLIQETFRTYNDKNYSDAICIGQQTLEVLVKVRGKKNEDYAKVLNCIASCQSALGNNSEAIRLEKKVLKICGKEFDKENSHYLILLSNLLVYYYKSGNYQEALRLGEIVLKKTGERYGYNHVEYAIALSNLAQCNSAINKYNVAVHLEQQAKDIYQIYLDKEHRDYVKSLMNLALYQSKLGNNTEAARLYEQALRINRKRTDLVDADYIRYLKKIAKIYEKLRIYSEVVRLCQEALELESKNYVIDSIEYATSIDNLAKYHSKLGDYTKACRLEQQALEIRGRILGNENSDYAVSLHNLAEYKFRLGNFTEAIRLEQQALEIWKTKPSVKQNNYVLSLNSLALFHSMLCNYTEAIRIGQLALDINGKCKGADNSVYAVLLMNLAWYHSSAGNNSEAIRLGKQALEIEDKVNGTESAISLNTMALIHSNCGNYSEAIRLEKKSLENLNKIFGNKHANLAILLSNLAYDNFLIGNDLAANHYAYQSTELKTEIILKSFANLTENERRVFWDSHSKWYTKVLNRITYTFPTDSLCAAAYNGALLSKGLILNSEIEFSKLLHDSGDQYVDSLYKELRINRLQLQRLYEKPIKERMISTDSLERVAYNQEQELIKRSKVYGDYTHNLRIQWEDVQNKLSDKSVAIEFASFPQDSVTTRYMALVLKKGMKFPQMVRLFEESHLRSIREPYSSSEVATLVWKPLAEYINDADTIYFGASGDIYKTAIEYVPHWSGDFRMSDKLKIFRLSSTRELALIKDDVVNKSAAIYGGITYNAGTDLLEEDKKMYGGVRDMSMALYSTADSLGFRGGVSDLPASKTEAINIDKALKGQHIPTTLKMNTQATEGSFKSLSGKQTSMLHIATHGFYWTEAEAKPIDKLSFLKQSNNHPKYEEDKAMTRSGLLFAGANNALRNEKLPEGVNDGILTASEISQLDLRGMDLVVLSACQTGLGEIGSDGVFGLQRGFKKAGANTLLMSLWKVDDDATQMLMTEFYRNLTSGKMSKYEALKNAQKYVREYEVKILKDESSPKKGYDTIRRYENPIYWAAFILLDAVE